MMVDGLMGLMVVDAGRWIPVNLRLFTLVFCSRFLLSSVALVFCSRLFALVFLLSSFCSRLVVGTICTSVPSSLRFDG